MSTLIKRWTIKELKAEDEDGGVHTFKGYGTLREYGVGPDKTQSVEINLEVAE